MKIKYLLFITTALIGWNSLFAQNNIYSNQPDFSNPIINTDCCPKAKQRIDSFMNNAPYVFEGRVVEANYKPMLLNNGNRTTYISFLFEIEKVYRGGERLKEGTIEVITKLEFEKARTTYSVGNLYILLCEESDVEGFYKQASNLTKLELFSDSPGSVSYFAKREVDPDNPIYSGLSLVYRTKNELIQLLKKYNLTPAEPQSNTKLKSDKQELEAKKSPYYLTKEEKEELYRQLNELDSIGKKNLDALKKKR